MNFLEVQKYTKIDCFENCRTYANLGRFFELNSPFEANASVSFADSSFTFKQLETQNFAVC